MSLQCVECRVCWAGTSCQNDGSCTSHRSATRCSWPNNAHGHSPEMCWPLCWSSSVRHSTYSPNLVEHQLIISIMSGLIIGYIQVVQLQACIVISQPISDALSNRISGRADPAQTSPPFLVFLFLPLLHFVIPLPVSAEKWQLSPARYGELLSFSNVVRANRGEDIGN